jgi:hypothetical protein
MRSLRGRPLHELPAQNESKELIQSCAGGVQLRRPPQQERLCSKKISPLMNADDTDKAQKLMCLEW